MERRKIKRWCKKYPIRALLLGAALVGLLGLCSMCSLVFIAAPSSEQAPVQAPVQTVVRPTAALAPTPVPTKTPRPTQEPTAVLTLVPEMPLEHTKIGPGIYLIHKDINPGLWRGEAQGSCYWARLSCVQGTLDCILANGNAEGLFYVEVLSTDYALEVHCEMQKSD